MTTIQHISFIMDGNRRYATQGGLAKTAGHRMGLDNLYTLVRHCNDIEIPTISVYAFSTENWNRSKLEVTVLQGLLRTLLTKEKAKLVACNRAVRFVGDRKRFDQDIQDAMSELEQETKHNTQQLFVCVSYGGRLEMVTAAKQLAQSGEAYTEENFKKHMWSHDMPEIDLLIRTGGDQRLSNYLPWQAAYAELSFTDTLWPDLDTNEVNTIIENYYNKVRINKGK